MLNYHGQDEGEIAVRTDMLDTTVTLLILSVMSLLSVLDMMSSQSKFEQVRASWNKFETVFLSE